VERSGKNSIGLYGEQVVKAGAAGIDPGPLKRVAFERIHAMRFKFLFLCMSLSQNRCALLGDMH
jgi:hypothetical protein